MPVRLKPTLRERLDAATGPLTGLWAASGSPVAAEIMAGSGAELILVDGEHSPVGLDGLVPMLQALEAYDATAIVRVPWNDPVLIKQFLDTGAQNLLVPMVSTAEQARAAVAAASYPDEQDSADAGASGDGRDGDRAARSAADAGALPARNGVRGIGSALARASRWGRVPGYVGRARDLVSLVVQIETVEGMGNVREIAAVEGVDAVFIGPADLAGSMGLASTPADARVQDAVVETIRACAEAGVKTGVNAFDPSVAARYRAAGADFVFVSADVTLMVKGSDAAVAEASQREAGAAEEY